MNPQPTLIKPRKALNKAYLKVKPNRTEIERFKANLTQLIDRINDNESEEYHKNLVADFLKKTWYDPRHYINTKGRNDLVIHNGDKASSTVGVIIEAKKPTNKAEMLSRDNLNAKAFHELVLYYLRERIAHQNIEVRYLIATNIYEWYIFDATLFERYFAQNKGLVAKFTDFESGRLADNKTDFFYKQIAAPFVDTVLPEIGFTYFNLREYEKPLRNHDKKDDNTLIALFKLLSPEHLLKLPFANDSNSLDKQFYTELLHIIGLSESKEGNKKLIGRKRQEERNEGSFLENAIIQLDSLDKISRLENPGQFGSNPNERLFSVALELGITWINRILFLKLMEAQLVTYHKDDPSYAFLNLKKIHDYDDLNSLFFQVLARKQDERGEGPRTLFAKVPYLNSSLFEPTEIEHTTIFISNLSDDFSLPIHPHTVLKDTSGKRRSGKLHPLEYLFEFLDAYDFAGESSEEIQEENKTLINASVLGLIFEKINGYKDGSFFTPGFITMYMCRETIRKAVVQKFNEAKGWNCTDLHSLYNKIDDLNEANRIVNSLKICDPAVGSGHFLVSALNEIISIKSDLKILQDREGRRLKEYSFEVVNDELIVTDEDGELFEYNPTNKESQRVQETLFHEKETLIENCLFGVDINPNSVKICRLRLWIELLKNAYYKNDTELETLPNIDINIKCGNSLISRFTLDADLKQALRKSTGKWTIDGYRVAVSTYRNAVTKEERRQMERLIHEIKSNFRSEIAGNDPKMKLLQAKKLELFNLTNQQQLFALPEMEKTIFNQKIAKLSSEIAGIETQIEEIRNNKIYENAFEWRFEFPEVLNDDGDYVGFDVVIGNPPYIRQEEFSEIKPHLKSRYNIYHSIADLLTYFVELGFVLLQPSGIFHFIISNKFTRANYGSVMRSFLLKNTNLTHYIDFSGIPVFDEATVDAAILGFNKEIFRDGALMYVNAKKNDFDSSNFENYLIKVKRYIQQKKLSAETWAFENEQVSEIKHKVEIQGVRLIDWNLTINYGIKTGCNEAFIIDGRLKEELIALDSKNKEIIKPLLRGRDIQKWNDDFQDQWLIYIPWHFPLHNIESNGETSVTPEEAFKKQYFSLYEHLSNYKEKLENRNSAEIGIRYEWYALQRFGSNYWQDFQKPKIIYPELTKFLNFYFDQDGKYYTNNKCFILTSQNSIFWLNAFFNSKLWRFCFRDNFPELLGGTRELRKVFFEQIPVKQIDENEEVPFRELIKEILKRKKSDPIADISGLESQIDHLVYQLYNLTPEEIAIVEEAVK